MLVIAALQWQQRTSQTEAPLGYTMALWHRVTCHEQGQPHHREGLLLFPSHIYLWTIPEGDHVTLLAGGGERRGASADNEVECVVMAQCRVLCHSGECCLPAPMRWFVVMVQYRTLRHSGECGASLPQW
ncbi:hypothetical protein E2C01_086788 [Portunus trituberculatus]|uniref:Uncharacterized protein n=1 Tax=Portunus trituberculatus TaxID=210409 RepID=A0A5B7J6B4_PORTR|nr:hypothetical protein [Portunus trituberculatus]